MTLQRATPLIALALACQAYAATPNARTFTLPSGIAVTIEESPFDKERFRVEGCVKEGGPCRINGRVPFGRTSLLPRTHVSRIAISFHGRTYQLDSSDMYDAWGTRPLEHRGKVRYLGGDCSDATNCRIRGLFSDGAGTFVAEWQIVDGVARRTVLTDSSDVVDLFVRHIDPPKFD
jgi:hypothetical protein